MNDDDIRYFGGPINGDWTAAIQATLTALGSAYVPDGRYPVSASLVKALAYNPRLRGAGKRRSVLAPTVALAGLPVVQFLDCRDAEVSDLGILGIPDGEPALCAVQSRRSSRPGNLNGHGLAVKDCLMGSDNRAGLQYGVEWSHEPGGDLNNDMGRVTGSEVQNFTKGAFHQVGVNVLQNEYSGNTVFGGLSHVVCDEGGSFAVLGGNTNELLGTEYVFNAGNYTTASKVVGHVCENNTPTTAGGIIYTDPTSAPEVAFLAYSRTGGATGGPKIIDHQAASAVRFIASRINLGQAKQVAYAAHPLGKLSLIDSTSGLTEIQYNGLLYLAGNTHLPGVVRLTNLGLGRKVQLGDQGGGFKAPTVSTQADIIALLRACGLALS